MRNRTSSPLLDRQPYAIKRDYRISLVGIEVKDSEVTVGNIPRISAGIAKFHNRMSS